MEPSGRHLPAGSEGSTTPRKHYSISERSRGSLKLYEWALGQNANDPALKASVSTRFLACVMHFVHPFTRTSFQS